jgi:Transglutaminase-like superfamily
MIDFYAQPGPLTGIGPRHRQLVDDLPADPLAIAHAAQGLVIQPFDATPAGVPDARQPEREIRSADGMLDIIAGLSPAPLAEARPPQQRVIGCCRHFVTLAVAIMRDKGIPARARCGFGSYFTAGQWIDHWIAEVWDGTRWVRVDVEHLDGPQPVDHTDLAPGTFATGGESWRLVRSGTADPMAFGIAFTTNFGAGEIRANAVRDLAALVKVEMLNWDEWGRMVESYQGQTGPDYDALIDRVADVAAADDVAATRALYDTQDLAVPPAMI